VLATAGEIWPKGTGSYIARCGLPGCLYCKGRDGSRFVAADGTVVVRWPGRLCQNGAREMAAQGNTYKQILAFYYGAVGEEVPPVEGEDNVEIRAFTWDGKATTVEALQAKYFFIYKRAEAKPGQEVWRIVEVREKFGDTAAITKVMRSAAVAAVDQPVAWHWADAPIQVVNPYCWSNRFVIGRTNMNGEVGPGMGAWITGGTLEYWKLHPDDIGPYASWVLGETPTDLFARVGMLSYPAPTNHDHMDVTFQLFVEPDVSGLTLSTAERARFNEEWSKYPATYKALRHEGLFPMGEIASDDGNYIGFGNADGSSDVIGVKVENSTWKVLGKGKIQ